MSAQNSIHERKSILVREHFCFAFTNVVLVKLTFETGDGDGIDSG